MFQRFRKVFKYCKLFSARFAADILSCRALSERLHQLLPAHFRILPHGLLVWFLMSDFCGMPRNASAVLLPMKLTVVYISWFTSLGYFLWRKFATCLLPVLPVHPRLQVLNCSWVLSVYTLLLLLRIECLFVRTVALQTFSSSLLSYPRCFVYFPASERWSE